MRVKTTSKRSPKQKEPRTYTHPLAASTLNGEELDAAARVLYSGNLTQGALCARFEKAFASYMGRRHAIFVNSGSSANLLALFILTNPHFRGGKGRPKFWRGMEVIVPALSWATTVWPIIQANATPVFVDNDPMTLQARSDAMLDAIGPRTFGIMPVHVMGNCPWLYDVYLKTQDNGPWLIEDTCEALGAWYGGKRAGTYGDIATFSFYFSHHMTTIEGGMLITDDDKIAMMARSMRSHGWVRGLEIPPIVKSWIKHNEIDPRYAFMTTGFNLRSTEINASLGLSQLQKLDAMNEQRNSSARAITAHLQDNEFFKFMQITEKTRPAWFGLPILCATKEIRKDLADHLEHSGVETRPIICGNITRQRALSGLKWRMHGDLTGAQYVMDRGLYIGLHPEMDDDYVAEALSGFRPRCQAIVSASPS